jgi:hypothetical protein
MQTYYTLAPRVKQPAFTIGSLFAIFNINELTKTNVASLLCSQMSYYKHKNIEAYTQLAQLAENLDDALARAVLGGYIIQTPPRPTDPLYARKPKALDASRYGISLPRDIDPKMYDGDAADQIETVLDIYGPLPKSEIIQRFKPSSHPTDRSVSKLFQWTIEHMDILLDAMLSADMITVSDAH